MRPPSPPARKRDIPAVLIREGAILDDDPWRTLEEGEAAPRAGDIVVPAARFLADPQAFAGRRGRVGVSLAAGDRAEDLAPHLGGLSLIVVTFAGFRDGRGYSTAALLRERFGYAGELRAAGDVLRDQLFLLLRVGFDSFALKDRDPAGAWRDASRRFRAVYQAAADGRPSVIAQRHARAAAND